MSDIRVFMPGIVVVSLGAIAAGGVVTAATVVIGLLILLVAVGFAGHELAQRYSRHGRRHGHRT
jgi:hypothetical protein